MLRICLGIFLVCASAHAMAQTSRTSSTANNASACEEAVARDNSVHTGVAHPRAIASRAKTSKPSTAPSTTASNAGGSSGGGDNPLPRQRGAKWQSFLPGMFR